MKSPTHTTYVVAALLATACWGAGTTLTKLALNYFDPATLLVMQLIASVLFLVCMAPLLRVPLPNRRSLAGISWLGILEPGLAYFLGLEGLKRIGAAEAVVLSSTESLLVVLLAWVWARERPRGLVLLLAGVGGAGAVLVAGNHWDAGTQPVSLVGDLLLMGGVLSAAVYVVWSSRLAAVTEPVSALIGQQLVALVFALVMSLIFNERMLPMAAVPPAGWALAAVSGVVQYACAFWLYLWALKGLSANVAGLYLSLIPVFGLIVAIPVLGERLTFMQWMGAILVLGSLTLLTRVKDEQPRAVLPSEDAAVRPT